MAVLLVLTAASTDSLLAQEKEGQASDASDVHHGPALEGVDPAQGTCRAFATMTKRLEAEGAGAPGNP
jgi:hypothetical protein